MKIQDREFDEGELIKYWHGHQRLNEIAAELGIEAKQLSSAWKALKRRGKLPLGDRPRHGRHVMDQPAENGRPDVGRNDPLLDALRGGKR
jgi:hypothetical protein